ncbi:MAG: hypothetical protein HOP17_16725 [Acidobacteria bacterium]|nr:hypothetical protein [Acidobacteriota bacterium]
MLLFFTTFLLLLAGVSLAILLKRLSDQKLLEEDRPPVLAAETYRPLFAPTEDELRLAESEERRQLTAKQADEVRQEHEDKLRQLEEFRQAWLASPNRAAAIELLHRASQVQEGDAYLETCESILAVWRDGRLADLPAGDLAQLLETHFWLLPAENRTPGASFRLKEAAAELRSL